MFIISLLLLERFSSLCSMINCTSSDDIWAWLLELFEALEVAGFLASDIYMENLFQHEFVKNYFCFPRRQDV